MQTFSLLPMTIIKRLAVTSLLLFITVISASAQSTNIDFPTPVITNEISGMIAARDIGDARLTRHYYLLTGTPGDLVVTVESSNLNGDVDLFTAGSLRPLAKLSMYTGLSTTSTSRSVYLRRRESIVLRVEARSASDDAGSYRILFSGGFEPVADAGPAPEDVEPTVATTTRRDKKTRRVNAAGARMQEEPEPVAEVKPPEPEPAPKVEEETSKPETTATATPAPAKPKPTKPARTTRTRTPRPARKPPATATKPPATTAKKRTATVATPPPPAAPAEPVFNPRLIIETRDGMRVERFMSEVRRVTVEKGQLIVITIDGKIERRPMSNVLRVVIEP
jgi:hypothetical protein